MSILSPQLAVTALEASRGAIPEGVEQEVLLLIASGYTDDEIAARLHLSIKVIETHVANALRHLDPTRIS
jgi:DNA-binding NarL/FixJ family response regulator